MSERSDKAVAEAVEKGVHQILDAPGVMWDRKKEMWYGVTEADIRSALSETYAAGHRDGRADAVGVAERSIGDKGVEEDWEYWDSGNLDDAYSYGTDIAAKRIRDAIVALGNK